MRKIKFRISCFTILCLSVVGCATTQSVNLNYSQIDYSDGISKQEAIAIVQKMYVDGEIPEEILKKVSLSNPKARYDKDIDTWWVTLRHKVWGSLSISSYVVYVDAKTGEIKGQRLQQQNVPVVVPIFI